jgi:hypothetical protein
MTIIDYKPGLCKRIRVIFDLITGVMNTNMIAFEVYMNPGTPK